MEAGGSIHCTHRQQKLIKRLGELKFGGQRGRHEKRGELRIPLRGIIFEVQNALAPKR